MHTHRTIVDGEKKSPTVVTPRCPDNRRELRVHATTVVVVVVVITYSRVQINQPEGCQIYSHDQLTRETFPCPRSRLKIWFRETGLAVPSRVSLLILYTNAVSYVVFQNIPGYDLLLLYTMDRFLPPTYACQRVQNLLYGTISYVVLQNIRSSYYYYLYCFFRLVFPLPTFVRTRNFLDVCCMANHIKAGMLIEKKVYVVHIKTSISTIEKTGMLYILKLVCLLQKHGKKRICCTY